MGIGRLSRATDPKQYDLPEVRWDLRGAESSPSRKYLRESLDGFVEPEVIKGNKVIDIGSGTGYLFKWLKERGARDISGIDPAETNIKTSTESYPWATSHLASLEEFAGREEKYDTALAVMVLEHFEDLTIAFNQMNRLIAEDGKLVVVIGDKDDELSTEAGQGKHIVSAEIVHEFADGSVEVRVKRRLSSGNTSVIFDIL